MILISKTTLRLVAAFLVALLTHVAKADPSLVKDDVHHTSALINMDDALLAGCETRIESIAVTGVQFGSHGGSLNNSSSPIAVACSGQFLHT